MRREISYNLQGPNIGGQDSTSRKGKETERKLSTKPSRKRLFAYLKGEWKAIGLVLTAILFESLLALVSPWVWGFLLVDGVIVKANLLLLPVALVVLLLTALGQNLFSFIEGYWAELVSQRIVYKLRVHLFTHLERLSLRFYDDRRTGELISRFTNDVNVLESTISSTTTDLAPDIAILMGTLLLLLYLDTFTTLLVASTFPAMILIALIFKGKIRRASKNVQASFGKLASRLQETIAGIRIIQSFAREKQEAENFEAEAQESLQANIKNQKLSSIYSSAIDLVTTAGSLIVLAVYIPEIIAGSKTFGGLITYLGYLAILYGPLRGVAKFHYTIQKGQAASERIFEIFNATPEIREDEQALELPALRGDVTFKNVSFGYNNSNPVIQGLNLSARAGERIALVGPSGVGKSTIVNLLLRFYDPWDGSVKVDGFDLKFAKLDSLRRQVGFVPQDPYLFSGSIKDNIAYGRPDSSEENITAAAKLANAHEFIMHLPDQYNSLVGERGVKLSLGQRQRIAIARAILRNPRILILDEATSSLDSASEELVKRAIEIAFEGRTVFVIAHRLATVVNADQIVVIWEGGVAEVGTNKELLAKGEKYAQMFHKQVSSLLESQEEPVYAITQN